VDQALIPISTIQKFPAQEWSVRLYPQKMSNRLNRSGPNFAWVLKFPPGKVYETLKLEEKNPENGF